MLMKERSLQRKPLGDNTMRLTVDAVVIVQGQIVLIRRKKPPFLDKLVFPGGHVEETDISLAAACCRELAEEIGLTVSPDNLTFLTILDHPDRDPRPGRRISIVFQISLDSLPDLTAGSDAEAIEVVDLDCLTPDLVGFDHYLAIAAMKEKSV